MNIENHKNSEQVFFYQNRGHDWALAIDHMGLEVRKMPGPLMTGLCVCPTPNQRACLSNIGTLQTTAPTAPEGRGGLRALDQQREWSFCSRKYRAAW